MTPAESLPPLDAGAVRRYDLLIEGDTDNGITGAELVECPVGDYVRHADHVAAIEKLAEERADYHRKAIEIADQRDRYQEARDKALADLVAVRAELERVRGKIAEVVELAGEVQDYESGPHMHPAAIRMVNFAVSVIDALANQPRDATSGEGTT